MSPNLVIACLGVGRKGENLALSSLTYKIVTLRWG